MDKEGIEFTAMKTEPLISIIMPAYNAAEYIASAVQSVLDQSYGTWELILVNDGSTDLTMTIVDEFHDPRIKVFSQQNKGVAVARNTGLARMSGDYFCFLDADDVLPPKSIESRVEVFLNSDENLEFVDGVVHEYNADLSTVLRRYQPDFRGNPFREMLRISEACYLGQTWLIKRRPGRTYAMRENWTHGEDFIFLLELSRDGGLYDFATTPILAYRRHRMSAMNDLDGLNRAYLRTTTILRSWDEVSSRERLFYWIKSRKIMFLSYLFNGKNLFKGLRCLFQWA